MAENLTGGYTGKVLRVNLSIGSLTTETIDGAFCRKYLGGTGFIAYYLLNEVSPGVEPLDPKNKLVFACGPLTGLSLLGAGRHCVGALSPLTSAIAKSEVGEHWGAQLKRAGFDVLIVEGRSEHPVYLWVHDGAADLRKADHIWGQKTKETQEVIRAELVNDSIRVAMIRHGGEGP